jgi:CRP-like cAMP-binding protein
VGFVVEGVLRLVKSRPDGSKHINGLLFEDAMFGRLFDRMPPLSVEAAMDATICSFERRAFEALLMRHSELEHCILLAVCDELDAAHEGMLILSSPRKEERWQRSFSSSGGTRIHAECRAAARPSSSCRSTGPTWRAISARRRRR